MRGAQTSCNATGRMSDAVFLRLPVDQAQSIQTNRVSSTRAAPVLRLDSSSASTSLPAIAQYAPAAIQQGAKTPAPATRPQRAHRFLRGSRAQRAARTSRGTKAPQSRRKSRRTHGTRRLQRRLRVGCLYPSKPAAGARVPFFKTLLSGSKYGRRRPPHGTGEVEGDVDASAKSWPCRRRQAPGFRRCASRSPRSSTSPPASPADQFTSRPVQKVDDDRRTEKCWRATPIGVELLVDLQDAARRRISGQRAEHVTLLAEALDARRARHQTGSASAGAAVESEKVVSAAPATNTSRRT